MDLGKINVLSSLLSVGFDLSGFEEENPPFDPSKSVFGDGDSSPTLIGVGSAGYRVSLGGWVDFQVLMDTPRC